MVPKLFGDMVPNIAKDYILLLGYSILYKESYLTRFNHQKALLMCTLVLHHVASQVQIATIVYK